MPKTTILKAEKIPKVKCEWIGSHKNWVKVRLELVLVPRNEHQLLH